MLSRPVSADALEDMLTKCGLEVEGTMSIGRSAEQLKGLVIGRILSVNPHPNADRLKITMVDIGDDEPQQIVCGAANAAAGQHVVVATIGTTLHPISGGAIQIKKSKIRGVESCGMICAEDEIGMGGGHDGIIVLEDGLNPGLSFAQISPPADVVFDLSLTPNRADAASHLGVAHDIAAVSGISIKPPMVLWAPGPAELPPIKVTIQVPDRCSRYASLRIKGIKVQPSPGYIQARLRSCGIEPISNVVDATNYVMLEIGQPLHAFDAEKIGGGEIIVRLAAMGETITTLDDKVRKLSPEDLLICDAAKPLVIAGVFGGKGSGITESTTQIFLESAHFTPAGIRKTSRKHGLFTDSAYRYERGVDPELAIPALMRCAALITDWAGGTIDGEVHDEYPSPFLPSTITLSQLALEEIAGMPIPNVSALEKLHKLGLDATIEGENLLVKTTLRKPDILRPIDVAEEVIRIAGIDNIPVPSRYVSAFQSKNSHPACLKKSISNWLNGNGYFESISLSFSAADLSGSSTVPELFNPMAQEISRMRPDVLSSVLASTAFNLNRQQERIKLYEWGRSYHLAENQHTEKTELAVVLVQSAQAGWPNQLNSATYWDAKSLARGLCQCLNLPQVFTDLHDDKFAYGETMAAEGITLSFGALSPAFLRQSQIKDQAVFGVSIIWDGITIMQSGNTLQHVSVPSRFPFVERDFSIKIPADVKYSELESALLSVEALESLTLFDVFKPQTNLPPYYGIKARLRLNDRTLSESDIALAVGQILAAFSSLKVQIREA